MNYTDPRLLARLAGMDDRIRDLEEKFSRLDAQIRARLKEEADARRV